MPCPEPQYTAVMLLVLLQVQKQARSTPIEERRERKAVGVGVSCRGGKCTWIDESPHWTLILSFEVHHFFRGLVPPTLPLPDMAGRR